jgi:TPR repeat protein
MTDMLKAVATALIIAGGIARTAAAGPLEDGLVAAEHRDYATAIRLLGPLAEQDNPDAQYHLGVAYEYGYGVTRDHAAAASWFRKAANQGLAAAQLSLGVLYENGVGVPQDFASAVSWYRKAAEQGNTGAQLNLGVMYENGWGVAQNYVVAHMWFSLAAAMGDGDAARNRDISAAKMTSEQIAEARRLAREREPKFTSR